MLLKYVLDDTLCIPTYRFMSLLRKLTDAYDKQANNNGYAPFPCSMQIGNRLWIMHTKNRLSVFRNNLTSIRTALGDGVGCDIKHLNSGLTKLW